MDIEINLYHGVKTWSLAAGGVLGGYELLGRRIWVKEEGLWEQACFQGVSWSAYTWAEQAITRPPPWSPLTPCLHHRNGLCSLKHWVQKQTSKQKQNFLLKLPPVRCLVTVVTTVTRNRNWTKGTLALMRWGMPNINWWDMSLRIFQRPGMAQNFFCTALLVDLSSVPRTKAWQLTITYNFRGLDILFWPLWVLLIPTCRQMHMNIIKSRK